MEVSSNKYTTALVGLGQVGQGYDYDNPDSSILLTHSTAIRNHPGFELVAGVDPSSDQRSRFEQKFSQPAFSSIAELQEKLQPEIYSLAVPTHLHQTAFHEVMSYHPKGVICEKPIAASIKEAEDMLTIENNSNSSVIINYTRRFNPTINKIKEYIQTNKLGEVYKGTLWYTKGIIHSGTHFVDLLIYLLGPVNDIKVISQGRKWEERDPEPDLLMRFGTTDIYFLSGREEHYSMGEFELIGTEGKVHFVDAQPVPVWTSQEDPLYPGYKSLGEPEMLDNPSNIVLGLLLDNLYQNIQDKSTLIKSNLKTAMKTLQTIERIKQQTT